MSRTRHSPRRAAPRNRAVTAGLILLAFSGFGSAHAQRPILPWEGSPPSKLASGPELRWNGSSHEAPAGAEIHWTITIVNDAVDAEIQVYVTDDIPDTADGLPMAPFTLPDDVLAKPPDGTVSYDDDLLQYEVLLLDPDESGVLVLRSRIEPDASAGSLICNSARVLYLEEDFSGPGSPAPPRYQSDTADATGTVTPTCVLVSAGGPLLAESTKSVFDEDGDSRIAPGEELSYQLRITNVGDAPATNLRVNDTLPDELAALVADSGGLIAGQQVSWDVTTTPSLASLAPGASVALEVTARALCLPPEGRLCNQAWISADELPFDVPTTTPEAIGMSEATCLPTVAPLLADSTLVAMDASGDGIFEAGERVAFEFRVTNRGTVAARELSVSMPLLPGELDAMASDGGRVELDRIVWDSSSSPALLSLDVDEELLLSADLLLDPNATGRSCRQVTLGWAGPLPCSTALSHDPSLAGLEEATCFDVANALEPPGEVPDGDPASGGPVPVSFHCTGGDLVVSWDSAPGADWHSLYRGPLSALRSRPWTNPAAPISDPENATVSCDLDGLGYVDADECLTGGESHYFLVTGSNAAGEGPLGEELVGGLFRPRPGVALSCP